jgi:hypothetical protein
MCEYYDACNITLGMLSSTFFNICVIDTLWVIFGYGYVMANSKVLSIFNILLYGAISFFVVMVCFLIVVAVCELIKSLINAIPFHVIWDITIIKCNKEKK